MAINYLISNAANVSYSHVVISILCEEFLCTIIRLTKTTSAFIASAGAFGCIKFSSHERCTVRKYIRNLAPSFHHSNSTLSALLSFLFDKKRSFSKGSPGLREKAALCIVNICTYRSMMQNNKIFSIFTVPLHSVL